MWPKLIWGGGPFRTAVVFGTLWAVPMVVIIVAGGRPLAWTLVSYGLGGVFAGVIGSSSLWDRSPLAGLAPDDRLTVIRALHGGSDVRDDRLAPALIAVANFTLGQHEKERRWAWMLWLVFLVGLGYAIYGAATASRGALVIGGALGLLCIGRALWWPRHLRHAEVAIAKAETYALARLGHDPL